MPDLQIEDLQVRFSGVVALNGVSMDIREGEIFSLVGPNGSGKTTLFNCVSGFVQPHHGTIYYGGLDLLSQPSHRIIDAGISRTFQNLQNVPYMTILDNVLLGNHSRIDNRGTVRRWLSRDQRESEEQLSLIHI